MVQIDANIPEGLAYVKEPYLHTRRTPLNQAVALDEVEMGAEELSDGFGNECE